jgi:hypothetical protein
MNPSTREDLIWLLSEEAAPVLETVQTAFLDRTNAVRIAKSLRKKFSPTRSALVMEQAQLRIRASRKFEKADEMFFTKRGLEQASSWRLGDYKASRFSELWNVADICCGIGGDLTSLALRETTSDSGPSSVPLTVGVDNDSLICIFARRNLLVNRVSEEVATVEEADFNDFSIDGFDGVHIDPDRRAKGRTVLGNNFSPKIEEIFEKIPDTVSLAIKVAPATPGDRYGSDQIEREWIGDHRECKQQILWRGPLTKNPGKRTATYVGKRGVSSISIEESEVKATVPYFDDFKAYLFEPHPSVLAAKLTDAIGRKYGLRRFTSNIVYLTGDQPISDPLLTQFEILDVVRLDLRSTVKVLSILGVGEVEVKKRGVDQVVADQFARMKLEGPNKATVILTRLGKHRVAVVAKRKNNDLQIPPKSNPGQ